MKYRKKIGLCVAFGMAFGGMSWSASGGAAEQISSIARGGKLYDKWFEETGAPEPTTLHPAYPPSGGYADKAKDTWRCKECHGWDYQGKLGAYATGKHATGIVGIEGFKQGDVSKVVTILKNDKHRYGEKLDEKDLNDLALFVTQGQVDMDLWINRKTKEVNGDRQRGEAVYNTICAGCHGKDGLAVEKMPPVGKVASENPWETLHKILNGEPDSKMPALRALEPQIAVDVLNYAATLPKSKSGK
ncbi:MAG: c-type cytochrome [Magnetococcales bacterium]|nr:c-type cytochrome [Magnetococcales bacterium]